MRERYNTIDPRFIERESDDRESKARLMCMVFIKVDVNSVIVLAHFECLLYDTL